MIRKLALLASLSFASALFAETADLRIVKLTTSKFTVTHGEQITVVMQWRNLGPDIARGVVATVGDNSRAIAITGNGSEHSVCEPTFGAEGFVCRRDLQVGETGEMIVTMLAPATGDQFTMNGTLSSISIDPHVDDNAEFVSVALVNAAKTADLSISPESQQHQVEKGKGFAIPLMVRNAGPDTANDVFVVASFQAGSLIPLTGSGDGWTCSNPEDASWNLVCRRFELAAGATSPIVVRVAATDHQGELRFYSRVAATGMNDPVSPSISTADVHFGEETEEGWARVLLPFVPVEVPGINGAQWAVETSLLLQSQIELPDLCFGSFVGPQPCPPLQPGFVHRLTALSGWDRRVQGGMFLFVRQSDADKLNVTTRIWDRSRQAETAGSGIPTVHERDFSSVRNALLGIPIASHYRYTLRVYDLEGRAETRVRIKIYANDEDTPRAQSTQTLTASPFAVKNYATKLEEYPAYLQLDPLQLASLAGATTMRIEVEPIDLGIVWSFVSVTNNETHHVTTFSAN